MAEQIAESSYDLVKQYLEELYNQANSLRFDLNNILTQIANTRPEDPPDFDDNVILPSIDYNSLDNTIDILTDRIENTVPQMESSINDLNSFLATINDMMNQLGTEDINTLFDSLFNDFPDEPTLNIPQAPNSPNITLPNEPTFIEETPPTSPTVNLPNEPIAPSSLDIPDMPNLLNVNIPPVPVINLPTAPEFTDMPMPTAPDMHNINLDNYTEPQYTPKFQDLPSNLQELMEGGNESDLTKLERALIERVDQELEDTFNEEIDALKQKAQKLGYLMPPGFYIKEARTVRDKILKRKTDAYAKIQEAIADLQLKNRQMGTGLAVDLEKLNASMFESKMERRLKYYLSEADIYLKEFDAKLKLIATYYETLRNKIALYQGLLDGEKTKIMLYQGQIDAQNTISNINRSLVESYKAQLQAIETQVRVYESQVKAYSTKVQAELNKIEMYKSQISAYGLKLETNKLKTDLYKAKIDAEKSKADIYESQMKGYVSIIQAESLKLENYKNLLNAQIAKIEAKLEIYKANFDFKVKALNTKKDILALMSDTSKTIATIEEDIAKIYLNLAEAKVSIWKDKLEADLKYFDALVRKYLAQVDISLKNSQIDLEHLKTIATIMSTLAAAYVNAMNVAASASDSESTLIQS